MTETTSPTLSGVAETLLLPLYIRALESQRPDALLKDDKAVALVKQMDYDSSWMTKMRWTRKTRWRLSCATESATATHGTF